MGVGGLTFGSARFFLPASHSGMLLPNCSMNTSVQQPNESIVAFEQKTGLTAMDAHLLLGIAYCTYAHYRSGMRTLPGYHMRHMRTISMLTSSQLKTLIAEVCNGVHR